MRVVNAAVSVPGPGIPLQLAYCSSKFACRGFFESTRAELIHEGSHVRMSMVHLPAVNTPQFDWCETTMADHPMPVPPIYQPEIPAKNLYEPVDADHDHWARGSFDDRAGGFMDPSFLKSLPNTAVTFAKAAAATVRYKKFVYDNKKRQG